MWKCLNKHVLIIAFQETLSSPHLLLRRAAVSCLRQLAQREAREVSEHALSLALESREKDKSGRPIIIETGLEGALFGLLDKETDRKLMSDVQDTLVSMLQTLAADNLTRWLALIKDVLQATSGWLKTKWQWEQVVKTIGKRYKPKHVLLGGLQLSEKHTSNDLRLVSRS